MLGDYSKEVDEFKLFFSFFTHTYRSRVEIFVWESTQRGEMLYPDENLTVQKGGKNHLEREIWSLVLQYSEYIVSMILESRQSHVVSSRVFLLGYFREHSFSYRDETWGVMEGTSSVPCVEGWSISVKERISYLSDTVQALVYSIWLRRYLWFLHSLEEHLEIRIRRWHHRLRFSHRVYGRLLKVWSPHTIYQAHYR